MARLLDCGTGHFSHELAGRSGGNVHQSFQKSGSFSGISGKASEKSGKASTFSGKASEKAGRVSDFSGKASAAVSEVAPDITRRIVAFLAHLHPVKTAAFVEAETGIPAASFAKWETDAANPSGLNLLRLVGVYGPPLLAACFERPPVWLHEASVHVRRRELEAQIAEIAEELAALDATPEVAAWRARAAEGQP